jgi:hypothetical protein
MQVQRLNIAIIPLDLFTLLWARYPFRENCNHWQVSHLEAGQILFKEVKHDSVSVLYISEIGFLFVEADATHITALLMLS